ncbi:MAG: alpha/beta fold hydrolase [Leptolyngbyaceae cyanobacterium RM1_1_2]|nr:alpha/beta fold hydrolase [Leptolyngbyaceae cyanobacterium RM1_1_2]
MFIPKGFAQEAVPTPLGEMVYYTNKAEPWQDTLSDAAETLVFFHGFGGGSSAYEWSKVYPAFASEFRIIAPDLIGWGRSAHPERKYIPEDFITAILEFLPQVSQGPTRVIASALTAAFVIRAAIARPELFRWLILTTAAGLLEFGNSYRDNFFTQLAGTPVIDQFLYKAGVATSFGIRSFLEQRQFAQGDRVYPEIVEAYLQSALQPNGEYAALAFVRGDLCFDLSEYIEQLTIPTAMIWGRSTEYTGPEVGRRLAKMNPEAIRIFYQWDDVGFTPQLELPAVTVGLLRRFMAELEQVESPVGMTS